MDSYKSILEIKRKQKIRKILICEIIMIFILIVYIGIYVSSEGSYALNLFKNKFNSITMDTFENNLYSKEEDNVNLSQYITGDNIELKQKIGNIYSQDSRVKDILINFDRYPLSLMNGVARNPEIIDYTINYFNGISVNYSENIDISSDIYNSRSSIPLFIQWDSRWGYASYGDSTIGISGCGPTCLSMIYVGLTGDTTYNPLKMSNFSEKNGYVVDNVGTSWSLFTEGVSILGLKSSSLVNSKQNMVNALSQGKYIIASMGPGVFTGSGHFIVFRAYSNGEFSVNDSFCKAYSSRTWNYDEFGNQIKAMWAIGN